MGKIKSHAQEWLDKHGNLLGYEINSIPELKDFNVVKELGIPVWEYYGYKTQEEYWEAKFGVNDEPEDLEDIEPIEY